MNFSTRIINFAAASGFVAAILLLASCKGRTAENMEPTGDTVEVVIIQPSDTVSEQIN